ncbi:MAG: hypothetical protein ABI442_06275 [Gemmatimonadaceae bacterium]
MGASSADAATAITVELGSDVVSLDKVCVAVTVTTVPAVAFAATITSPPALTATILAFED